MKGNDMTRNLQLRTSPTATEWINIIRAAESFQMSPEMETDLDSFDVIESNIGRVLSGIPPEQIDAMILVIGDGIPISYVSKMKKKSKDQIRWRVSNGLQKLRHPCRRKRWKETFVAHWNVPACM